jgi:cation-transporting ATPase 13A3/4/5
MQVFGINMMYMFGIIVGNYQYLIQDLFFATGLAAAMAITEPCRKLSIQQPASSLMSADLIVPVLFNFFTTGLFQVWFNQLLPCNRALQTLSMARHCHARPTKGTH